LLFPYLFRTAPGVLPVGDPEFISIAIATLGLMGCFFAACSAAAARLAIEKAHRECLRNSNAQVALRSACFLHLLGMLGPCGFVALFSVMWSSFLVKHHEWSGICVVAIFGVLSSSLAITVTILLTRFVQAPLEWTHTPVNEVNEDPPLVEGSSAR
jgi:hypothetical protein